MALRLPRPRSSRTCTQRTLASTARRKVHAVLHRQGHRVARCTVKRLMRVAGLRGVSRAKGQHTTIPGAGPNTRPDLVRRNFTASEPNGLWVCDIT
ncbi:hypothetical protein DT076_07090 [Desertihabitans brevis]|uniref:HTH-like domain-containing protein n=1 Tax=Desertihabitans brevis TaxID=2268447 RepID=A0A367YWY3_9ACTN|nr:hypothetical protein DT076_07090 [Desertihabitans brevis]